MELSKLVRKLDRMFKIPLAESWDNVGLLVQPTPPCIVKRICLTNDLTEPVLEEAILLGANFILSYHPPIFQPLKRLTQNSDKERIIIKCIESNIAIYSPHTALDSVSGGINDWLLSPFDLQHKIPICKTKLAETPKLFTGPRSRDLQGYCIKDGILPTKCDIASSHGQILELINNGDLDEGDKVLFLPEEGYGRIGLLKEGYTIKNAIDAYKKLFGVEILKIALGRGKSLESPVSSVGVCAGSGGRMFVTEAMAAVADLLVTGEASHHEQLATVARGASIITAGHSVSERGFLAQRLRPWLLTELADAMASIRVDISATDAEPGVYV